MSLKNCVMPHMNCVMSHVNYVMPHINYVMSHMNYVMPHMNCVMSLSLPPSRAHFPFPSLSLSLSLSLHLLPSSTHASHHPEALFDFFLSLSLSLAHTDTCTHTPGIFCMKTRNRLDITGSLSSCTWERLWQNTGHTPQDMQGSTVKFYRSLLQKSENL